MNLSELTTIVPILLVDDRSENLVSLEALLHDQGYELVTAMSGNEALRLTLKKDFALVLLDVQMPEMDGFETAELMRANPKTRHIPIIFVTAGMKDILFQFKGYDIGAVDYLTKPIEPLILQSKVKVFAELFLQRRENELHNYHLEELVDLRTAELRQSAAELKANNAELIDTNRKLKDTEELLRAQVKEFIETHDQLLATEEMLRVQIMEYEVGQQRLHESNRNLQTLFDVSPLAIVVSSYPECIIREINNTFGHDFGYPDESVIGKTGVEIGLWGSIDDRERFLKMMHEQHWVSGFATEIITRVGEYRNALLYSNLMDFNGEQCMLIVFLDITEQKRLEDQILQTQKMEVIGQLAGGVAHDFNNMLTAILGSVELLERYVRDNSAAMKLLGNIQQAASRSADLTGQLLAFSRKGQKNRIQIHIDTVIHDVITLLERTIDKKIRLDTRLLASNSCVVGDQALLHSALINLVVNARDAMPEGGVITFCTANVELDSDYCRSCAFILSPGRYIEISVSDTGAGMTKEVMSHVFEPFFTTKDVGKGTGLGLAAVYNTITDLQGCITVSSEPGTGTVFKLYLPLCGNNASEVASAGEPIHGTGGILFVDDEEIIRAVGKAILEDVGYKVYLAEDGEQALEVYEREKKFISLVILDMVMPRMGGKETLMKLKECYPDICVLISSGFHQEGTVVDLVEHGAKGFLQKPYSMPELCRAVADAIGNR